MRLPDEREVARDTPILDTFHNRTAFDPARYPDNLIDIIAFIDGYPIQVTYYSTNVTGSTEVTNSVNFSIDNDNTHVNFEKIYNFEFKASGSFVQDFDPTAGFHTLTGEGVFYPGKEPSIGDVFLYQMYNKIIMFKITDKSPLTIDHATCYRVTFSYGAIIDNKKYARLETMVVNEVYFVKGKYLSSTHALLNHQDYNNLKDLEKLKVDMSVWYMNRFYSDELGSITRPDGVYDPYVVRFLQDKISLLDCNYRPVQLLSRVEHYENSIWYYMAEKHSGLDLIDVYRNYTSRQHIVGVYHTTSNSLVNKRYVLLVDQSIEEGVHVATSALGKYGVPLMKNMDTALQVSHTGVVDGAVEPYIFGNTFYTQVPSGPVETIIHKVLTDEAYDVGNVLTVLNDYKTMSEMNKFYLIPIYIHMTSLCIKRL